MRGVTTEIAGPELGRGDCGAVDNELVGVLIKRSRGLNASDVRAVTEFSLGIASHDLGFLDQWHPCLLLLFAGKAIDGNVKHRVLKTKAREETLEQEGPVMVRSVLWAVVSEVLFMEGRIIPQERYSLHQVMLLLFGGHFVELVVVPQLRAFQFVKQGFQTI